MSRILLWAVLFFSARVYSQDSTIHLRISVVTCAPGTELYSIFGHTAIRIIDSIRQTDLIYNYGTFDFNDPDFYMKFTRGKLDYMLSVSTVPDFMYEYQSENRDVHEQVLKIPNSSKQNIQNALTQNLSGPSRYYKYDFLYNNCTTRIRDLLFKYAGLQPDHVLIPEGTSFRNMLHEYLNKGNQPWSKLGIDLLLGSPIDKKVDITNSMFLPDYLMKGIDSSTKSKTANILQEKQLLNKGTAPTESFTNTPLLLFSIFSVILIALSFLKKKPVQVFVKWADCLVLLITGLLGCLLLFMWFGSDHKACAANYNLLWALPTNLIAALAIWKNPSWLKKYFRVCMIIHLLTVLLWFWLPQQLNIALLPIAVLLLQRCWQLKNSA
ncbi:MAG: DUF4105 domain-containing protein [Bacteroidota bacterium]